MVYKADGRDGWLRGRDFAPNRGGQDRHHATDYAPLQTRRHRRGIPPVRE